MLKKENRLKALKLYNPKQIKSENFSFKLDRNNLGINRFAFVVSKKIDKRATRRNFIKRKLRARIEEAFSNIEKGWDFVFYPKGSVFETSKEKLFEEIRNVFRKENLLK